MPDPRDLPGAATREMWDRFFAEDKWRKRNARGLSLDESRCEEIRSWLDRLARERATEAPRPAGENPFPPGSLQKVA